MIGVLVECEKKERYWQIKDITFYISEKFNLNYSILMNFKSNFCLKTIY